MTTTDTTRQGLVNHGAFFSPYYLYELLARQHGDELDPRGRETNRRPLRHLYRRAEARYGASSSAGEAWTAWHRELLEALGFHEGVLHRLPTPVETTRHGRVPISHGAWLGGSEQLAVSSDQLPFTSNQSLNLLVSQSPVSSPQSPLVFIDCHGFATDLDRSRYPTGPDVTEEPIARALEFALDQGETRWALVLAGQEMRLYRKGGSVARQFLQVNFPAFFDADRADEWTAFWGLFRYEAFVPDAEGKCLLDRVLAESQRHAARIADDLRENIVLAMEAIIQGILDDPANKPLLQPHLPVPYGLAASDDGLQQLFEETLYFLYRLLFILYAESRDLLPVGESLVYRDGYSLEHLRDLAERPLPPEAGQPTYFIDTLRTLCRMLHDGFPGAGSVINAGFQIDPFNGQLFDPRRTALLDACRIPDRAMHAAIAELSLSRPKRRHDRRERFSYADLGVDQLGSIYEGLLVYEPAIVREETVLAKVKSEERLVTRAQAEAHNLEIIPGSVKRPGQFVLRLWGGRRKGSGSYYTPQEITSFLVKEALEPLVTPIIEGCGQKDSRDRPLRHPDEILELKVCDPAMGSGAFLIQACRYLAEAYGRARIAAGLDEDGRLSLAEFSAYKRLVAERCLYGVDLNPMAVELGKVSLWLETLARGKPLNFLDAHLRCGNSLIGAPLRDGEGRFTTERLTTVPDAALKLVSKEASQEAKAEATARIKHNKEEMKTVSQQRASRAKAGQLVLGYGLDWGFISLQAIEAALTDYQQQRVLFERSDADLSAREAVALVHEKEDAFHRLQTDPQSAYLKLRQVCDLWCAIWFWPQEIDDLRFTIDDSSDPNRKSSIHNRKSPPPPTTQTFLELVGALLGTQEASLSRDEQDAYWQVVKQVWRGQRFFHWELEFPEIWREKNGQPQSNGGFDAIVGNPPWDLIQENSDEFFSNWNPIFRGYETHKKKSFKEQMLTAVEVATAWKRYILFIVQGIHFIKQSQIYVNQGRGHPNLFKLFSERGYQILRNTGGIGMVLPSGFYMDAGTSDLRRLFLKETRIKYLIVLANEKFIFPSIHHAFKLVLLVARRVGYSEDEMRIAFRLDPRNAISPQDLYAFLASLEEITLEISPKQIERFSPNSLSILQFTAQRDVEVTDRLFGNHPLLGEPQEGAWNVDIGRELNLTEDRHYLNQDGKGLPVYEGKMIHQFDLHYSPTQYFITEDAAAKALNRRITYDNYRLGYREISGNTLESTLISSIIPANSPTVYTIFCCRYWDEHDAISNVRGRCVDLAEQVFLCALFNSLPLNYLIRQRISNHVNLFHLYQMPIPRLTHGDKHFEAIVHRAIQLTCTTPELADLWKAVTNQDWIALSNTSAERAQLRAEIDALVVDLYNLDEENFVHILSTFPLLNRDQPALPGEPKSFITRDLALLELFKLRGLPPPSDIVPFFAQAGADISGITGPIRSLAERVAQATRLGAVAYVPSGRGGQDSEDPPDEEEEDE